MPGLAANDLIFTALCELSVGREMLLCVWLTAPHAKAHLSSAKVCASQFKASAPSCSAQQESDFAKPLYSGSQLCLGLPGLA